MKVIFLDIDGVLNNVKTAQRHRGAIGIDPYLVAIFNRIIFATDAQIVLSSTWRLWPNSRDEVRQQVMDYYDVTPTGGCSNQDHFLCVRRGCEIKDWLNKHPEVTRYAILDDDYDFDSDQPLFKTSFASGLTVEVAQEVIEYLNTV